MQRGLSRFGGLIIPVLTPLDEDEELEAACFERHLSFLIDSGADALFILGSNGEGPMLRSSTRLRVVRGALRIVNGRLPVIAGVLEISTARILEEMSAMSGRGLAGYVVTTPLFYDSYTDTDLDRHFTMIAGQADAPVLIYNIPQYTGCSMSENLIRHLADVPNIAGLKDSSGNWAIFQGLLLDRPRTDFALLQGSHALSVASLLAGCDGLVPGYANLYPSLFVQLLAAARERRWSDALDLQRDLNHLLSIRGPVSVHANKIIGKALGFMGDNVTSPLPRLDDQAAARLVRESIAAGLPVGGLSAGSGDQPSRTPIT